MANPYTGQDFFGFFATLAKRTLSLVLGEGQLLATDEIQLLTLVLLSLSCALVGTFLVQARKTMIANALSHTILQGIVIAFLLERAFSSSYDLSEGLSQAGLIIAALVSALLTTFCTEYISKKMDVQEDASIGLILTLFFASGVLLLTLFARNAHLGTELVMGSVDGLHIHDLISVFKIFVLNLLLFILFFKEFTMSIFDPSFALLQGMRPTLFRYLLLFQTALVSMVAFQAVGVIMVLALFVAPILIVRPFIKTLGQLILFSSLVSALVSLIAVSLSRHILSVYGIGLSTGALMVLLLLLLTLMTNLQLTYSFLTAKIKPSHN